VNAQRKRLDVIVTERGLLPSRQRARALIMAGSVRVDGRVVDSQCAEQMGVALACRVYRLDPEEGGRYSPVPSRELIRRALLGAEHG